MAAPKKRRAPHRSSHVISKRQRRNSTETGLMPPIKGFRSLHILNLLYTASVESTCLYLYPIKSGVSRKEVFQPHLPVRLPCYDLAPITSFALGRPSRSRTSGAPGFHGLTGGVYKARERIHRAMADARLLANPASWGRVADPSPN